MNTVQSARDRFVSGALATASGSKVIEMAYDRLDRDLSNALAAIEARQVEPAHTALTHAQDLVNELLMMLDTTAWEHAPSLASIYRYVIELLTFANMKKSPIEVQQARFLLGELGAAFAQAAGQASPASTAAAQFAGQATGSRLSLQA
jgi:flagellar protein FliS